MITATSTSIGRSWDFRKASHRGRGPLAPVITPSTIRIRAKAASVPWLVANHEFLRRGLNIVVAMIGIVLTAPLMVMIAIAIKVTSRGSVLYTQPRVGVDRRLGYGGNAQSHRRATDLGGKIFTIYKFRTMRPERGPARQVWAAQRDPRITAVGRILRATRLDELPQLFNVLRGDMNIVGPRPEQPQIFAGLQKEIGRYRHRQRVLPGITGLAQVTLPYDQSVADVRKKVALDLEYIRARSAAKDLMIMAKTMPVMVMKKGSM